MADTNTIIGESILVKGNLEGDEDLTIQGRVEGAINLTQTLIVEPSGIVKAEVSVANVVISGVVVGNLSASDSVEITESGKMLGDIQAPRVIINEGALFKGQVDMGDLDMPRPEPSVNKPVYRPSMPRPESIRRPAPAPSLAPKPEVKPVAAPRPVPRPVPKPEPPKKVAKGRPSKKKVVVRKKKRR
jgi:cytoskeletal protein CcmA (bactofilin family)